MARAMMARPKPNLHPRSEEWDWQLRARCRERESVQFFHPDDDLGRISRRLREEAAKRICESCPVRRQCATHALMVGEEYGVWGGFSETDRSILNELGWRDTLGGRRLADIVRLERRLARARARAQRLKEAASQPTHQNHNGSPRSGPATSAVSMRRGPTAAVAH